RRAGPASPMDRSPASPAGGGGRRPPPRRRPGGGGRRGGGGGWPLGAAGGGAGLRDGTAPRPVLLAADIATSRPLVEYGLDSQMAVEVAGELEAALGQPVPATLAWNHPTIDAIAAHIAGASAAPVADAVTAGAPPAAIAIVAV